ncbi:carboxymuconolactone decarboxylase family protein [Flavobacterium sp. MC2016-06]|jgi:uncharacterized peroxidase-related enzyme|uniref:carboxymuconolactone decarboxylase family protein n=1 Tax=Flavobacterium sp. MC2016-06 TaxID=2676308 RepID=UPI0012BA8E73|nr:carboxymuconolactone decarboxylase family protein [Flavobacterium sp. MC2016-06]MBU3857734.1 carboxymuconolactone decarboxylase family protein [Flavobacterium sp. MC2016-06]
METIFSVPKRDEVSVDNQKIFDQIEKAFGKVPNLYATLAYSKNALGAYFQLQNRATSLSSKESEVVNLVVSQVNNCIYCLSAHSIVAQHAGFTEEQTLEIRSASISFDTKLDALAKLTKSITEQRGEIDSNLLNTFFDAGYTKENLVDTIVLIGDKTTTNLLHSVTKVPVDFPLSKDINLPAFSK